MSIDLHTHTTASDGTLTPAQLVEHAAGVGLEAVAVTDHDTVDGIEEALEAGKRFGVEVIPGCELSTTSPQGSGWLHIVGLWVPSEPQELLDAFEWLQKGRYERNHEIVEKLRRNGISITYDKVAERAAGTIGRPHFAQELVALGVVSNPEQAFREWLGERGKAYVPKRKLSPEQAIETLHKVGATSVLAHPYILGMSMKRLEQLCTHLRDNGLEAIEVDYTEHTSQQRAAYGEMADRLSLMRSGGSDFHGEVKPLVKLGTGRGDVDVPYSVLETLKRYRSEKGLWVTERP